MYESTVYQAPRFLQLLAERPLLGQLQILLDVPQRGLQLPQLLHHRLNRSGA